MDDDQFTFIQHKPKMRYLTPREWGSIPGFIDAHCHIGVFEDSLGFEGSDGNEENDPSTPHLRILDAVNPFDRCFSEALDARHNYCGNVSRKRKSNRRTDSCNEDIR